MIMNKYPYRSLLRNAFNDKIENTAFLLQPGGPADGDDDEKKRAESAHHLVVV